MPRAFKIVFAVFMAAIVVCSPVFVNPAWAALVRGTAVVAQQDSNGDPWTGASITIGAGQNLLVALCFISDGNTTIAITRDGQSFTSSGITGQHSTVAVAVYIYYLVNPNTGTADAVLNPSESQNGGCVYIPYSGADTSTPITNSDATESAVGTTKSDDITCAAGNDAVSILGLNALRTVTTGANQDELFNGDEGSRDWIVSAEAGAGTTTLSYTLNVGSEGMHGRTCVMAAAATTAAGPLRRRGQ